MLMHVGANPLVGTGPMLRGLSLAQQWIANGGHVTFVTSDIPALLLRKIAMSGCQARYLSTPVTDLRFATRLCELAKLDDCQTLVTDGVCKELVANMATQKRRGHRYVVLDHSSQEQVDFCSGDEPSFALIRRSLQLSPEQNRKPRRTRTTRSNGAARCLLAVQEMNPKPLSRFLKQIIGRFVGTGVIFDIVTPLAAAASEQLIQQRPAMQKFVCWHRNPDRAFLNMDRFDLAVLSKSADFYECAYARVPSLLVRSRQALSPDGGGFSGTPEPARQLTQQPWSLVYNESGGKDEADMKAIGDWIEQMHVQNASRKNHGKEMTRLIDGHGAQRLCRAIESDFVRLGRAKSA